MVVAPQEQRAPMSESQGCFCCSTLMGWGIWDFTAGIMGLHRTIASLGLTSTLPAPAAWDGKDERRGLLKHVNIRAAKEQGR